MDAHDFVKLALDPGRLAVLGALAAAPGTADDIAERARQDRRSALETLGALVHHGLARSEGDGYVLDVVALREIARDLPAPPPPDPRVGFGMTEDEQTVLARFFQGARLQEMPTGRAKRLVVLQRLALEFEPGVHYDERDVNETLTRFHDDYASLRRYLVDEGFLDRDRSGKYWRSGGRVE